jgi:hypothetical protein
MIRKGKTTFNGRSAVFGEKKWSWLYADFLFLAAIAVAKYGAGLTWRQVLVGLLLVAILLWAADLQRKPDFTRVQFTIALTALGAALVDEGIYSHDEVKQWSSAIWAGLGPYSTGRISFSWLEQDLFFMSQDGLFSESAKLTINLKPFGRRASDIENDWVWDCIELRSGDDGYELVLIKAENRRWEGIPGKPEGSVLPLIKLPYEFLANLQKAPGGKNMAVWHEGQREVLEQAGLNYYEHDGDSGYQTKYAQLDWQTF